MENNLKSFNYFIHKRFINDPMQRDTGISTAPHKNSYSILLADPDMRRQCAHFNGFIPCRWKQIILAAGNIVSTYVERYRMYNTGCCVNNAGSEVHQFRACRSILLLFELLYIRIELKRFIWCNMHIDRCCMSCTFRSTKQVLAFVVIPAQYSQIWRCACVYKLPINQLGYPTNCERSLTLTRIERIVYDTNIK